MNGGIDNSNPIIALTDAGKNGNSQGGRHGAARLRPQNTIHS